MKIGVISDTHGLFDEKLPSIFRGVDLIVHAGDIGKLEVIDRLEEISLVVAVEGNNDWFGRFPTERIEEFSGRRFLVRHIFGEMHQLGPIEVEIVERLKPDVLIFGHSHRPYKHVLEGTLLFNPGSAGPRRFSLPRTVGLLTLEASEVNAEIVSLD